MGALLETPPLSDEELGKWCRERGLHTHHLKQWRQELEKEDSSPSAAETRSLRQKNRELKRDLRLKEKALAETSALLVLKKKCSLDLGGDRGRLISTEDRRQVLLLVAEAVAGGCRKRKACEALGVSCPALGTGRPERPAAREPGADGIRCDMDGNVWCGARPGVQIVAPDGTTIGVICLPEVCANVCFGGAKRNRLFMTASQSLYAVYVNVSGA